MTLRGGPRFPIGRGVVGGLPLNQVQPPGHDGEVIVLVTALLAHR
ncbi:MAG TPA: hypothetical protein VIZ43_30345 [Trebonia sp.]